MWFIGLSEYATLAVLPHLLVVLLDALVQHKFSRGT